MPGNGRTLMRSSLLRPSLLEDIVRPWNEWLDEKWPFNTHMPAVNVKETDDNYIISMAAPGLEKKDFKIDVNGTLMTISAERDQKTEEKDESYSKREYSYSSFSRSFTLPDDSVTDKIDATYVNGELKLVIPKKEEAKKTPHQKISVH
ncbi:MAG: Hsp20/alpha crystallin family protein [bacterium]|jgi:HSP20 family protein